MRILLVPLDERPCNTKFPAMLALTGDVELVMPSPEILSDKKRPADINALCEFLLSNAPRCDAAILSVDMLVYGGLVPSRLHHLPFSIVANRLSILKKLRNDNRHLDIYAFVSVMRAPSYNTNDEEPDYYAFNGRDLFRRAYLLDRATREGLSEEQQRELDNIHINHAILDDYEQRRKTNLCVNEECIHLVTQGIFDYLVLPQDDSSPYGYTAKAQTTLRAAISASGVQSQIAIYPGSDEVAMTLLSRAVCSLNGRTPSIRAHYASVLGPELVPLYEDRPMFESLKSHARACGARLCDCGERADIELMINAPGKRMQESSYALNKRDITYDSYRNLQAFVEEITRMTLHGCKVAVCDSAYANGGDPQLLSELDEARVLPRLTSFAGWNTNCNTLGTTLSQAVLAHGSSKAVMHNLAYRIIEDVLYQTIVRSEVSNLVAGHGGSYQDISSCIKWVQTETRSRLQHLYNGLRMAVDIPVSINEVHFPWKRMFEIDMRLQNA